MKDVLISVIIPVYKVEPYLDRCVSSVVNQNYSNLEIILVEDGSPDKCGDICDEWARKDNRIKVIHQKNQGQAAARNAGLEVCKGNYIAFLDSDDWYEQCAIEQLKSGFVKDDIGVVSGAIQKVNSDGDISIFSECWNWKEQIVYPYDSIFVSYWNDSMFASVANKMFRKDVIGTLRFKVGRLSEDLFFLLQLAIKMELQKINMVKIPHIVYNYYINPHGITRGRTAAMFSDITKNKYEAAWEYVSVNPPLSAKGQMLDGLGSIIELMENLCVRFGNPEDDWYNTEVLKSHVKYIRKIPIKTFLKIPEYRRKTTIGFFIIKYIPLLRRSWEKVANK